ncbi:MAG: DoxX family protein [Thermoleophilia bacterium]|nr:DoxX family protein [Thermoleophilia bacterium]
MGNAAESLLLAGRILFVLLFLNSAVGHLRQGQMMVGYAQHRGMPLAGLAGWPAGLWELVGSISLAAGIWPDLGALMLGVFTIPTALWFHQFWGVEDEQQRSTERMNFLRNAALLGACLVLFVLFSTVGHDLGLAVTGPLFDLR